MTVAELDALGRATDLLMPYFCIFLTPQFGFWPLRPLRPDRAQCFGSSQNPGCGAVRSDAAALALLWDCIGDRRCKKAPSNGSIQLKATGSFGPRPETRMCSSISPQLSAQV